MQFNVKQPSKKFNPVTVELTFESQEELNWFYWITNCSFSDIDSNNGVDIEPNRYSNIQMSLHKFADNLLKQHSM